MDHKPQVKFETWIKEGFNLYKDNFGLLALASLVTFVLGAVTAGVLAGPLLAGYLLITLALFDRAEPKPQLGDLFKGFRYFLHSLLFLVVWGVALFLGSLILGLIPVFGQLASLVLVYGVQALLMFGLFIIVERDIDFWAASMESINTVKTNFWPFLGLGLIAGILGSIGGVLCVVGAVLTAPIQACILTVAYREVFGEKPAAGIEAAIEEPPQTETRTDLDQPE